MTRAPYVEEVRKVVFDLKKDSPCDPDSFSGEFYQSSGRS